ncbi:MAG: molybdopterin molybdotransferase MoeA [Propylenella sp.]
MSLLPVDEAVGRLLAGVEPLGSEHIELEECLGRVLAGDIAARLTQPPFPASAMDGYAVRAAEATAGARLKVVGMSRAGERFAGALRPREAVRIFTGAPVPDAADAILIQENAERDGDVIRVSEGVQPGRHLRPAGLDFRAGEVLLAENRRLDARALSLAAAMGHATLPVRRRPRVAVLANGDELVPPGTMPGPDQIVSSNGIGLAAFVRELGGEPIDLGIAPDRRDAIGAFVGRATDADILVVAGGASVGEHDLVQAALADKGMALDFWKIAMRPGKPLMVGRLGAMRVLGLPGNPVSALVCSHVFLKPLVRTMLGLPMAQDLVTAKLGAAMGKNDNRQDYVRARVKIVGGEQIVTPFGVQDSSMLATLAAADALIVRPIRAPAVAAGESVPILPL